MTIQINDTKTLRGFSLGNGICFYGSSADIIAEVCDLHTNQTQSGTRYLLITDRQSDIYYPRLVKAGYRLAIQDTP